MSDPLALPEIVAFACHDEREWIQSDTVSAADKERLLAELRRRFAVWRTNLKPTREQLLQVTHEENRIHARLEGGNQQFWDGLDADWRRKQKPANWEPKQEWSPKAKEWLEGERQVGRVYEDEEAAGDAYVASQRPPFAAPSEAQVSRDRIFQMHMVGLRPDPEDVEKVLRDDLEYKQTLAEKLEKLKSEISTASELDLPTSDKWTPSLIPNHPEIPGPGWGDPKPVHSVAPSTPEPTATEHLEPPFDLSRFDPTSLDLSHLHRGERNRITARQYDPRELSLLLQRQNPWTKSGKPGPLPPIPPKAIEIPEIPEDKSKPEKASPSEARMVPASKGSNAHRVQSVPLDREPTHKTGFAGLRDEVDRTVEIMAQASELLRRRTPTPPSKRLPPDESGIQRRDADKPPYEAVPQAENNVRLKNALELLTQHPKLSAGGGATVFLIAAVSLEFSGGRPWKVGVAAAIGYLLAFLLSVFVFHEARLYTKHRKGTVVASGAIFIAMASFGIYSYLTNP